MLIKAADDKQPQIDALSAILARPDVDGWTGRRVQEEIAAMRAGIAGEREAAYEIDFWMRESANSMLIHDLRLEVGHRVAQIDHLIINRLMEVWVCETKHFYDGVAITEAGHWEAIRGQRREGRGSPIEQNRNHIRVLEDVFAKDLVWTPRRVVKISPVFRSLVLISKNARIELPRRRSARVEGIDSVIKVDQLESTLEKAVEATGALAIARFVSSASIERVARELAALHKPIEFDWSARFGLPRTPSAHGTPDVASSAHPGKAGGGPTCASCGARVSPRVAQFSRAHTARFGGQVYCFDCQKRFS
jgi:nuclease-like protein